MSGLDLYQTQRALALLLVYAAVLGFALGGFYDVLRFLRVFCGDPLTERGQGSKRILFGGLRFVTDLAITLMTAISLILLCYYANDGQLRAPAVLGMAGGFFVYMQTLGRLTVRIAKPFTTLVKRAIRTVFRWLLRPVELVGGLILALGRFLWRMTVGKILQKRREKQTDRAVADLIDSAKQGFGICDTPTKRPQNK